MISTRSVLADAIVIVADELITQFGDAATTAKLIKSQSASLVDRPSDLGDMLSEAFREPFESDISQIRLVNGCKRVITYAVDAMSTDADAINPTTYDLDIRKYNLTLFADTIRASVFCDLADAMAGRDYQTAEEVSADENYLSDLFGQVQASSLDGETLRSMSQVFVAATEVLGELELRLPSIIDVEISELPASTLAYMLYDDDDRVDQIVALNPLANPILYAGTAKALVEPL